MPSSDLLFQTLIILIPVVTGMAAYFIVGIVVSTRFLGKTLVRSIVPVMAGAIGFGVGFALVMLVRLSLLNR